jgi:S-phase kinase-associated protein 1
MHCTASDRIDSALVSIFLYHNGLFACSSLHTTVRYLLIANRAIFRFYIFVQSSKEGDVYEVPISVAKMSQLVAETLDGDEDDESDEVKDIPLPNVSANVLQKVIEFCKHYQEEPMTSIQTPLKSSKLEDLVQQWYADFVKIEKNMLFDLVAAANFMDIKPLLDLTCLAVSILIKGKSAVELREMFNISSDFSPEEDAQIKKENGWVEKENAEQP